MFRVWSSEAEPFSCYLSAKITRMYEDQKLAEIRICQRLSRVSVRSPSCRAITELSSHALLFSSSPFESSRRMHAKTHTSPPCHTLHPAGTVPSHRTCIPYSHFHTSPNHVGVAVEREPSTTSSDTDLLCGVRVLTLVVGPNGCEPASVAPALLAASAARWPRI